jgi:hypothetical protein
MLVSVHNGVLAWEVLKTHQLGQGKKSTIVGINVTLFQLRFFIKYRFARRPVPPKINNPGIMYRVVVKGWTSKDVTKESTQAAISLLSVIDRGSEGDAWTGLTGI